MTASSIVSEWDETVVPLWGHRPMKLGHGLHNSPLFSRAALAQLIEHYPRENYALVNMGAQKDRRLWREGEIGGLSGDAVIEAITRGRMWLNLRDVANVDARYRAVLDGIFDELHRRLPGFDAPRRGCGILISSPGAQVYYHADLPGQALMQIIGRKRVFVYPATPPFITAHNLEDIALFDMELDVPYADWYDRHAEVIELEPGDWAAWPLNAPHRVENHDCLNVSMTISYTTEEIRRLQMVNLANGILRHRLGVPAGGRTITGPSFLAKAALQKALRGSSWVKSERAKRRAVEFTLDHENLGQVRDLAVAGA